MGIRTKFNSMGGKTKSSISYEPDPIQICNYAYLVKITGTYYGTAPTITVTNLSSLITTSGATKCGQVSAKFILLGGKIYNTTTSAFISNTEGFTSIGSGYNGVLAVKDQVIYCFDTSGNLLYTDSSLHWKAVEAPIYMQDEYYRKTFFALTYNNELYEITIGESELTKTKKAYGDTLPHGSNDYYNHLNYLKGTTVYNSSGSTILTDVSACSGNKSSLLPSDYRTDSGSKNREALLAVKSDGIYMLASTTNTKILSGTNCKISQMGLSACGWSFSDGRTDVFWPLVSNGSTAYIVLTDGTVVSTGISNTKLFEGGIYTTYISRTTSSSSKYLYNSAIVVNSSNTVYVVYGNGYNSYKEPSSLSKVQVSGISGNINGIYGGTTSFLITAV